MEPEREKPGGFPPTTEQKPYFVHTAVLSLIHIFNPALKVDGVLLTLVDGRTNLARQTADTLRQSYGSFLKIYRSEIPVARWV